MIIVGHIAQLTRYPIKSMAGAQTDSATLGWHGLDGDRRFAFRRITDRSAFPFLSASSLPELMLYHPIGFDESASEPLPTHVRTPDGHELAIRSAELNALITERHGSPVELMHLRTGIFDDAAISLITQTTIDGIGRAVGADLDRRRFRANILVASDDDAPFHEDAWVGHTLVFGDDIAGGPAVRVTLRDVRCMMINLDPDTAQQDARLMKEVVRLNANNAGVYATVIRTGTIRVGDRVSFVDG